MNTKEVWDALMKLGQTGDEVAEALANKGIRGRVGATEHCPIAVYLREQFPGEQFSVSARYVRQEDAHYEIPSPVHYFIHRFDMQKYPELIV